jgi:COP9 signalosome complex subunit 7
LNNTDRFPGAPNLPTLTENQATKLRQLSLLTLASSSTPLTYDNLLQELSLPSPHALETLLTQSIYSSLLTARLSPTSTPPIIHITSVAPLRDLRPLSLVEYTTVLSIWESRCNTVITTLENSIKAIRHDAAARTHLVKQRQEVVDQAVLTKAEQAEGEGKVTASGMSLRARGKGSGNKRDLEEHIGEEDNDEYEDASEEGNGGMDIDDGRASIGGVGMGRSSKKRGAPRSGR